MRFCKDPRIVASGTDKVNVVRSRWLLQLRKIHGILNTLSKRLYQKGEEVCRPQDVQNISNERLAKKCPFCAQHVIKVHL